VCNKLRSLIEREKEKGKREGSQEGHYCLFSKRERFAEKGKGWCRKVHRGGPWLSEKEEPRKGKKWWTFQKPI